MQKIKIFSIILYTLLFVGCSQQVETEVPAETPQIYEEFAEPIIETEPEVESEPESTPSSTPQEPAPITEKDEPKKDTSEADVKPISPHPADSTQPMIALTFDDGPSSNTRQILDILSENSCTATFFLPGYQVIKYENTARAIIEQGSEIGGHSWGHTQYTTLTGGEIWSDIEGTNNAIFEATGVMPTFYRPPYGSTNDVVKNISREMGVSIINWSVDSEDWKSRNPDKIYADIMRDVKSGSIILCHDTYSTTVDAMRRVIPALIDQGYELVTVSKLLGDLEPGKIYNRK